MNNIVFFLIFIIFLLSFIIILVTKSYIKKLIGLSILQLSVILFYVSISYIEEFFSPIKALNASNFVNPLPHVLMLTAIVVGVSTLSVGVSIALQIVKDK